MSPAVDATSRTPRYRSACDCCNERRVRCSKTHPVCDRCRKLGLRCVYGVSRRAGRRKASEPRVNTVIRDVNNEEANMNHRRNPAQQRQSQYHPFVNQLSHPSWLSYTSVTDPSLAMATNSVDTMNMAAFNQQQAMQTYSHDLSEIISIGPQPKSAGQDTASPSTVTSQSTSKEECTCAADMNSFLYERKEIITRTSFPNDQLLALGEEALRHLAETIECKRANHRTYFNFFGTLSLYDLILRLYRRLGDAVGSELPPVSENDTLTPTTHPFASDGQDGIFGSASLMRSTTTPGMATRRSLRLSNRDSMSLPDPYPYSHFTAPSAIDPALRSGSISSASMNFEQPDMNRENEKNPAFEVLRTASTQLEELQRSLRRFQQSLAILDPGPSLSVGEAVYIPSDDPVPAFTSLIQRLDYKRSLIYRDIIDLLRREPSKG